MTLNQPYCPKVFPLIPHLNLECAVSLFHPEMLCSHQIVVFVTGWWYWDYYSWPHGPACRPIQSTLGEYRHRLSECKLFRLVRQYGTSKSSTDTFLSAVVWQPPIIPLGSYPIEGTVGYGQTKPGWHITQLSVMLIAFILLWRRTSLWPQTSGTVL